MKKIIIKIIDVAFTILMSVSLVTTTILCGQTIVNNIRRDALAEGYDNGYDEGYEKAQERYERDIEDWRWTDAGLWELYHDCNMYGLPDYAKPYCEQQQGGNNA